MAGTRKKRPRLKIFRRGVEAKVVYADKDKEIVTKIYELGHRRGASGVPITEEEMKEKFETLKTLREKGVPVPKVVEIKKGHTMEGKPAIIWKEEQVKGHTMIEIEGQWQKVRTMIRTGDPGAKEEYQKLKKMVGKNVLPSKYNEEKVSRIMANLYKKMRNTAEKIREEYVSLKGEDKRYGADIDTYANNYIWDPEKEEFIAVDAIAYWNNPFLEKIRKLRKKKRT